MSKMVELKPSHKQLFAAWENELRDIQQKIGGVFHELVLFRLEKIAVELGIDTVNENWQFDFGNKAFVQIEQPQTVTPTIPGKKRGRPKKEHKPIYNEEGHTNEDDITEDDEEPMPPE